MATNIKRLFGDSDSDPESVEIGAIRTTDKQSVLGNSFDGFPVHMDIRTHAKRVK